MKHPSVLFKSLFTRRWGAGEHRQKNHRDKIIDDHTDDRVSLADIAYFEPIVRSWFAESSKRDQLIVKLKKILRFIDGWSAERVISAGSIKITAISDDESCVFHVDINDGHDLISWKFSSPSLKMSGDETDVEDGIDSIATLISVNAQNIERCHQER